MAPAAAGRVEKRRGKRAAEEELDGERRLRKKFDRLRLDRLSEQTRLTPATTTAAAGRYALEAHRQAEGCGSTGSPSKHTSSRVSNGDGMQVDDTKTRVYITDLEEEIAEIEEEERQQALKVMMPEMEKQLMSIPTSVLTHKPKEERNNALVLYRVPAALGIPAEQDSVRAAMTDVRERAREKMAESYNGQAEGERTAPLAMSGDGEQSPGYDSDPMEIDES